MKTQTYLRIRLKPVMLLLGMMCTTTFANVIYVNDDALGGNDGSSWANAYGSLQDALDAAVLDGMIDQIWVAAGTYYPSYDYEIGAGNPGPDSRYNHFRMINDVGIYGGFAGTESALDQRDIQANETILSGNIGVDTDPSDNCYHVFFHPDGTGLDGTAVLDGFTITAGNADADAWPHDTGGGMYNEGCSPTVTNCTFSDNSADNWGGGMANDINAHPTVTDCTFTGNTADNGGGILNYESGPELTNCIFSDNTTSSSGGGIYNELSGPDIIGCTFTGNTADYAGGGIYNLESSPILTNSTFSGNTAESGGGVMNEYISDPIVTNCIFNGNTADLYGGGMENFDNCAPAVTNCTFSGNGADYGGGMDNFESSPDISNSIFWGNAATSGENEIDNDSSAPDVSYCDIQGGWSGSGTDNIDEDPMFVDADLQLQSGSPCIDRGDNDAVTEATDINGDPRIIDGDGDAQAIVDMGAYEYTYINPNTAPVADAGEDIAMSTDEDCTALVTLDGSGSYDPDGDPLTYQWFYDDELFAEGAVVEVQLELGEHAFTLIVNDGTEDSEPAGVLVTVYDDTPLQLSVTMSHEMLWPANNKMVEVWPVFEVGDSCGGEITIELIEITCNQPCEKDIETDDGIFLRAKRLGSDKAGRLYTLVYLACDEAGNEAIATAQVKVPHDMGTRGKGERKNKSCRWQSWGASQVP